MTKKEHNCKHCNSDKDSKECIDDCDCNKKNIDSTVNESHISENEIMIKNEELAKKCDELKDTLQRVYAEFQNYKKRTDEDRKKFIELSNEELIKKILPIIDNLELALSHKKHDGKHEDEFSRGIELIYAQFIQVLEDEGIKKISSYGKFDPKFHEVLIVEGSDKEDGVILEEFQKGYVIGNKVLRHSKVKIAKHKQN